MWDNHVIVIDDPDPNEPQTNDPAAGGLIAVLSTMAGAVVLSVGADWRIAGACFAAAVLAMIVWRRS